MNLPQNDDIDWVIKALCSRHNINPEEWWKRHGKLFTLRDIIRIVLTLHEAGKLPTKPKK